MVKISNDEALDLIMQRVEHWTDDEQIIALYEDMYTRYIENGYWEEAELDIMAVVDNDFVNWCSVIDESDDNWKKLVKLHKKGEYDVSCDNVGCSFIEAVDNEDEPTCMLVRN